MSQHTPLRTRVLVTLGNTLPSVIALALAVVYLGKLKPLGVGIYFVLYFSWYKPYLFGPRKRETAFEQRGNRPKSNEAPIRKSPRRLNHD